jgi:hypothetical protein
MKKIKKKIFKLIKIIMKLKLIIALLLSCICTYIQSVNDYFIEAESFVDKDGWVVDNQSMMQMGSPYLHHGLGVPVSDATHTVTLSKGGRFEVRFNGVASDTIFGTKHVDWHWQDGGLVRLQTGKNQITLHDLTGFNGRCDAIYLTADFRRPPPENMPELKDLMEKGVGTPGFFPPLKIQDSLER